MLGVNMVINFSTFLYKKCRDDCLPSQEKKAITSLRLSFIFKKFHEEIQVLAFVFSPFKSRAVCNLLERPKLLCLL